MSDLPDTCVLWLVPKAWEEERRILPQYAPIPFDVWLRVVHAEGLHVRRLDDSKIAGGPCDQGHVIAIDAEYDTNLFALPPEALPALNGLLSPADYSELLRQSGVRVLW